ncbi:MAG: F0F1 ATP synthase subunit B [Lachnospirales bacterium]
MDGYVIILNQQTLIQIGIQILNTAVLCAILSWLLYKPVTKFLNARKEKIANQIDTAEQKLADADKLKSEYEAKLKNIEEEKRSILDKARAAANKNSQEIISEAKSEAENIRNRAALDIQREQEKAKDEIKNQIVEISSLISGKFISANMTDEEKNKLIDDTISDLEGVEWH